MALSGRTYTVEFRANGWVIVVRQKDIMQTRRLNGFKTPQEAEKAAETLRNHNPDDFGDLD
jgi:hypothetical protein